MLICNVKSQIHVTVYAKYLEEFKVVIVVIILTF